jgi:hypothetical protein
MFSVVLVDQSIPQTTNSEIFYESVNIFVRLIHKYKTHTCAEDKVQTRITKPALTVKALKLCSTTTTSQQNIPNTLKKTY